MAKKNLWLGILAITLVFGMTGTGAFAQEEHKHEPFDVLLGLNYGMGITPNIGDLFSISEYKVPKGNYALTFDLGVTGDFYLFNWLSFNTGMLLHPEVYATLEWDRYADNFKDIAAAPFCLTIPLMAHFNIPKVEWLYTGIGLNLNFPLTGMLDSATGVNTKGSFFVGVPMDLGFDFIQPDGGGMRFFFRVTPEVHKGGTTVPIGFIWQIWNWKIFSKG